MESSEEILKKDGWIYECYGPVEIRHDESNSFASGHYAVDSISSSLRYGEKLYLLRLIKESFDNNIIDRETAINKIFEELEK